MLALGQKSKIKCSLLALVVLPLAAATPPARWVEFPALKFSNNYMAAYYLSRSPTTTPWDPCWSPDGKWIAFSLYGSIWKVNVGTDEATEITHGSKLQSSPTWSPDGKWIVYTAEDNWRAIQLEILNVETGETRALTHDNQVYLDPVFSPDGRWLAFVSSRPNGNLNVFARPFRGGDWAGEEVAVTRDYDFGRPRPYFSNWDLHIEPAWLQDGRELLLVSNHDVALGSGNLWRVPFQADAMPSGRVILNEQSIYRTRPNVSPDGKRVIYSSNSGGADQYNHLYMLPVAGGQPYKLTFGDYDDFYPRWSPDGEWIAYISNEEGPPELYLLETYGGAKRKLVTGKLYWKQPMGAVRVTIRDQATGRLTAARIAGSASNGRLYAPAKTEAMDARLNDAAQRVFYTTGSYQATAPAGPMTIEVTKGFEYWPVTQEVVVRPGQTLDVRIPIKRLANPGTRGWFSGTTHAHMNYGGNFRNTPENLLRMGRGEGLNVIDDLVANKDNRVLDWQYFRPGANASPASDLPGKSMLIIAEEYRPPFWGHVSFLGLKDHLISPFTTGYEGTALASLYPSNSDMFKKARAEGAITGYVHPFNAEGDPLGRDLSGARGFGVDLALGFLDYQEFTAVTRGGLIPLFHAWNNDFHLSVVGGEDSIGNMQERRPLGIIRTYAYLSSNFTMRGWLNAIKQGHTYATSGPLVEFRVNGKMPGDVIILPAQGLHQVRLEGSVRSIRPLHRVLIYHNGSIWRELRPQGDGHALSFSETAKVATSGWFALAAEGDDTFSPSPAIFSLALTTCIRVYVGDQPIRSAESAEYFIKWIAKLRTLTANPDLWRSQAEQEHVFAQYQQAEDVYRQREREAAR